MTPNIINLHSVKNRKRWLDTENNVYVGRPNKWGNPFKLADYNSRREVVDLYKQYVLGNKQLLESLTELRGKVLGCWCAPNLCHAEVLHQLAGNSAIYPQNATAKCLPGKMSSPETVDTRKLIVGNLGTHITGEQLRTFFDLDRDDRVKIHSSVELSTGLHGENIALIHAPKIFSMNLD